MVLENDYEFEEQMLNAWISKNKIIKTKLEEASKFKQLSPRESIYNLPEKTSQMISPEEELLWNFYADYLHLTNNRLGILNKDEGYLGFLIMQSLQTLLSDQNINLEKDAFAMENLDQMILDQLF